MKKTNLLLIILTASQIGFAQSTSPSPYCNAGFDDSSAGIAVPDGIDVVTFGTLNNVSNSQWPLPHYVFYNNLAIPTFNKGSQYPLSVTFNVNGGCGYGIWIDWNQNNVFDANEKVAGTGPVNDYLAFGSTTVTPTITIPTTAASGNTRMRVRIVEDDTHHATTTSELACNASTSQTDVMDWGETEDYTINIATTTGVTEIQEQSVITIAPNPFTSQTTITFNEEQKNTTIKLTDVLGNSILQSAINSKQYTIEKEDMKTGIYFLQITNENNTINRKIIVQ